MGSSAIQSRHAVINALCSYTFQSCQCSDAVAPCRHALRWAGLVGEARASRRQEQTGGWERQEQTGKVGATKGPCLTESPCLTVNVILSACTCSVQLARSFVCGILVGSLPEDSIGRIWLGFSCVKRTGAKSGANRMRTVGEMGVEGGGK